MPTYNNIRVQSLPVNYAGDLTLGKIEDVSTNVLVYLYYENLPFASQELTTTTTVDGTVTVTIPTDNRLQRGHYRFETVLASSYEKKPFIMTYEGSEVNVWAIELDTEMNCGDVDANVSLVAATAPISC